MCFVIRNSAYIRISHGISVDRKIYGISLHDLFHSLWLKSLQTVDPVLEIQSAFRWSNEISRQLRVRRCNQIRKVVAKRKFKLAFIRVARRNWDKQQLVNGWEIKTNFVRENYSPQWLITLFWKVAKRKFLSLERRQSYTTCSSTKNIHGGAHDKFFNSTITFLFFFFLPSRRMHK